MKKIDLALRDKMSNIILNYKKYVKVNNWLVKFTTEPAKVLTVIEAEDIELFGKLESVTKGIHTDSLKVTATEIGMKVISGYSITLNKSIVDGINFITNKENNPLNVLAENVELIYKDVNTEQLAIYIKSINSTLALREYATNKIVSIIGPLTVAEGVDNVSLDIWLNRLVNSLQGFKNTIPVDVLECITSLKQLDAYTTKKVNLIKDNLDNETFVSDEPEGDIDSVTEVVEEDLDVVVGKIITDSTDEAIKPLEALNKLTTILINSSTEFDKVVLSKDKVMLDSTVLLTNMKLINKYTKDYIAGEELPEVYERVNIEVHNVNTLVVERLEKFTGKLINESIKLNYNANVFLHLNILIEKVLLEAVIK